VRRAQPRHAPALLVDQYRRVGAIHAGAQVTDQGPDLVRVRAVAREQDETPRSATSKQAPLIGAEHGPGNPDDRRGDRSARSSRVRLGGARISGG
jgi:hypothetical protein